MDSLMAFHIGDNVMAVANITPWINAGDTGTVCGDSNSDLGHINNGRIRVCWDKDVNGHSCGGNCEDGHGRNCYPWEIAIADHTVPAITAEELYELWEEEFA